MASLDDLPLGDRQAVADFQAFLNGAPACILCLMPSEECRAGEEPCCPNCRHGRIQRVEGPARSEFHAAPSIVYLQR